MLRVTEDVDTTTGVDTAEAAGTTWGIATGITGRGAAGPAGTTMGVGTGGATGIAGVNLTTGRGGNHNKNY
jgi:hypothetical protein